MIMNMQSQLERAVKIIQKTIIVPFLSVNPPTGVLEPEKQ